MVLCHVVGILPLLHMVLQAFCQDTREAGIHYLHPTNLHYHKNYADKISQIKWAPLNESVTYSNNIGDITFIQSFMRSVMRTMISIIQGSHLSVGKLPR